MSTRRNLNKNAALAVLAVMATAGQSHGNSVTLYGVNDLDDSTRFMYANPRHENGRGKRGGNGKGRQWWNK
jgi:hypothetical protein